MQLGPALRSHPRDHEHGLRPPHICGAADGKVLLGGNSTIPLEAALRIGLIRFQADGTIDPSFVAACGYDVQTIAVQPTAKS